MLFLLAYGKRYFDGFVEQLPASRQDDVRTVGRQAALRGRRYLLIVLAHSVVNGVVVGAGSVGGSACRRRSPSASPSGCSRRSR